MNAAYLYTVKSFVPQARNEIDVNWSVHEVDDPTNWSLIFMVSPTQSMILTYLNNKTSSKEWEESELELMVGISVFPK